MFGDLVHGDSCISYPTSPDVPQKHSRGWELISGRAGFDRLQGMVLWSQQPPIKTIGAGEVGGYGMPAWSPATFRSSSPPAKRKPLAQMRFAVSIMFRVPGLLSSYTAISASAY